MLNVYDLVCNRLTGKIGEVEAAAKDSGLFKGMLKIRYQTGEAYYVSPNHVVDSKFSSEIIKANKQKRSPCLEDRNVFPLDPIKDFNNPVFATAGADEDNL